MKPANKRKMETIGQAAAAIYDDVCQKLCLANLHLATIEFDKQGKTKTKIRKTKKLILQSVSDLRKIAELIETT